MSLVLGDVPEHWENMPKGSSTFHIVDLDSKSKEYQEVLKNFQSTVKLAADQSQPPAPGCSYNSIIKIQRIQNLVLHSQYVARKKVLDQDNPSGHTNEMRLFHGTSADTCPKINQQGFNRSFAGRNGMTIHCRWELKRWGKPKVQ